MASSPVAFTRFVQIVAEQRARKRSLTQLFTRVRTARIFAATALFVGASVAVTAQTTTAPRLITANDSALNALLATASVQNRLPPSLVSYKAQTETEVAILLRREEGQETVVALEQIAGTLRWTRAGMFDQHLTGHRAQQLGPTISVLTWLNEAWLSPVLYGNRLRTRVNTPNDSSARRMRRQRTDTVAIIHPLAADRDRYYLYSRGDTLVTLHSGSRNIPIVRVNVEPRPGVRDSVAVFIGDIDLDASRGTLVRMRGHFARAGVAKKRRFGIGLVDAIAYIEYENAEHLGEYWLPARQRIEVQVSAPMFGDARSVLRMVTKFPEIAVNDTVLDSLTLARSDSLRNLARRRLTYAAGDSISSYRGWTNALGELTNGLHSDDFTDIGPDRLRTVGKPRLDLSAPRIADVIHFNRVEGLYTGLGVKLALRDAAPGVVMRANTGYAWEEKTVRGRFTVDKTQGPFGINFRIGRSLDLTNDFRNVLDSGATLGALGSDDPYDYVDRKSVSVGVTRAFMNRQLVLRLDQGYADDRYAPTRLKHGIFGDSLFKPNRGVDEGGHRKATMSLEWHPNVNAEAAMPGYSARFYVENGAGSLNYTRTEVRVISRKMIGPLMWTLRGDAGQVAGSRIPPQQLFELGRGQNLPGYENKEFAGSRAAVLRTGIMYTSRFLNQPIRFGQRLWLPGLAPGLSVGLQNGWADAPTTAGRASILRLGTLPDSNGVQIPVSRVTGRVRTTASAGVRFFAGTIFAGWARAIDRKDDWRFMLSLSRTL